MCEFPRYRPRMVRRLFGSYGELALVFGLGALAQVELWLDADWASDRRELALLALAMTAALLLRVRRPLLTLGLLVGAFVVESALLTEPGNDPMALVIMLLVAVYSAGAHTSGSGVLVAALVVLVAVGIAVVEDGESMNVGGFLFFGVLVGGPFLTGVVIRIRRERERLLVGEREERARAAVAEERTRIARELHDVVAHAVSVIVLQARGARHELDGRSPEARQALDAIESTAASALSEMRRLLAILRDDDDGAAFAPQPTLAAVESLAAKVREAGLPVEVSIEGNARELPQGVDLSAYRIVQEALTNALKHAGPAQAYVCVRYYDDRVEVEVADDGRGSIGDGSNGHGLVGMRERVAVYGGALESGPRAEGGFSVRASLPL
jgi:signal transduction histidine kinase